MSTVQELNELLKEAQNEIEIWQQVSILLTLINYSLENNGEAMDEGDLESELEKMSGALRAAQKYRNDMGNE
jgi:hypothetical protein